MPSQPTDAAAATPENPPATPDRPTEEQVKAALESNTSPFGPAFFVSQLGTIIAERGQIAGNALPRVVVHLLGGTVLDVHHIARLTPRWVAFEVYSEKERERTRTRSELVPYGLIIRVTVDSMEPDDRGVIGFRQDRRPDMLEAALPEATVPAPG